MSLFLIFGVAVSVFILVWAAFRLPSLGLGLLIAFLPILSQSRQLFREGDIPFPSFETMAVLIFAICILMRRLKFGASNRIQFSTVIAPIIFIGTGILSCMASRDLELSLKILIAGGVIPCLCYFITCAYIKTLEDIRYLVYGIFALALQVAIHSSLNLNLLQSTLSYESNEILYAKLYNEIAVVKVFVVPSATVAVIVSAIPLAAWYSQYGKWYKSTLPSIVIIGVILTAATSFSRGSWLGTAVALISSLPLWFRGIRNRSVLLIVAVLIVGYFMGIFDTTIEGIQFRLSTSAGRNIDNRSANYLLALQSGLKYLVVGVGLGRYIDIYQDFPTSPASLLSPLIFAHSLFLTLIPEIGTVGTFAFFYIFLSNLFHSIRLYHSRQTEEMKAMFYALSVGLISTIVIFSTAGVHLVAYFTTDPRSTYFMAPVMIVTFISLGVLTAAKQEQPSYKRQYARTNKSHYWKVA